MEDDQRCAARNGLDRRVAVMSAVQKIRSLRKSDLIQAPQHSPPTNKRRQSTANVFASDLCSSTTRSMNYGVSVKGYTEQS
jgi:hypothetical protein